MDDDAMLELVYSKAAARRRRVRRMRTIGSAALVFAVVVSVAVVRARQPDSSVVADDSVQSTAVVFNGIVFELPPGWTTADPGCGMPADRTLVVGNRGGSCPASTGQVPTTSVQLTAVFGPQLFVSGRGVPIDWRGTDRGLLDEQQPRDDLHVVTLLLPRRNAVITAQSPELSEARRLALEGAHAREVPDPGLLDDADEVLIQSFAGTDGDGLDRRATITAGEDIRAITADLRALPVLDRLTPLCEEAWSPQSATITLKKGARTHTFAARFDECAQVINGDGGVSVATRELRADIIRLVPNSGISDAGASASTPGTPSCSSVNSLSFGVRPTGIFFGCATSKDNLSDITWTKWRSTTAAGAATRNINECLLGGANAPSCPDDRYKSYRVTVMLSNPGTLNGEFVFRTITLSSASSTESAEATTLFCGPSSSQDHCDVPSDSWGYVAH